MYVYFACSAKIPKQLTNCLKQAPFYRILMVSSMNSAFQLLPSLYGTCVIYRGHHWHFLLILKQYSVVCPLKTVCILVPFESHHRLCFFLSFFFFLPYFIFSFVLDIPEKKEKYWSTIPTISTLLKLYFHKTDNHLSPEIFVHTIDHAIWRLNSNFWIRTGTTIWYSPVKDGRW